MRQYLTIFVALIFSLIILISCQIDETNPTSEGSSSATFAGDLPARWPISKFPLNVQVSSAFSDDEIDQFQTMQEEWDDAVVNISFFSAPLSQVSPLELSNIEDYQDGVIGIYKSNDWFSNVDNNALAVTQYFAYKVSVGGVEYLELNHADIIVNYNDFTFGVDPGFSDYDLPSVVLHEMGHLLGLKHENDFTVDSVMQPYMLTQTSERELYPSDENAINSNYESDSSGSSNQAVTMKKIRGKAVRGIIELKKDGSCTHKQYLME